MCFSPSARADAVLNECSQLALESALAVGGRVTVNCDGTLVLSNTVTIASSAVLDATGHRLTISSLTGTNAADAVRLFNVEPGVSFSLVNLTLTAGRATNGGAIYNHRGFLSLDQCVLSNNFAIGASGLAGGRGRDSTAPAGGSGRNGGNGNAALGGAIYNLSGTVVVSRCSFLANAATAGPGGGGGNGGNATVKGGDGGNGGSGARAQGGAIYNAGRLTIDSATFMLNTATGGPGGRGGTNGSGFATSNPGHGGAGGLAGGGAIYNAVGGVLEILNSTFALNNARAGDSASAGREVPRARTGKNGAASVGGAIANYGANALANSTFFANKTFGGAAGNGAPSSYQGGRGGDGGTAWGGNFYNGKRAAITNCTFFDGGAVGGTNGLGGAARVAGNNGRLGASRGGNIANGNGSFVLKNSLIAFALPGNNGYGAFTDAGHNLSSDRSIRLKGAGSMTNTDPRIGILGRNGGPTETVPLLSDSPAIDAGDPENRLAADQRGVPRPHGGRGDIGAYEFGLTLLPPVISSQPQSQTAQAGGMVRFLVVASGDPPLGYFWRRAGNAIPGATGPVLTLNNLQPSDAASYEVVVFNNSGSVTSSSSTLTLINRVTIPTPPADSTVAQGATATFRVGASGDTPLSYQWLFNRTNVLTGATLISLTLPDVATNQAGEYSVLVSNPFSSATSAVAVLTVTTLAPTIAAQPQNITVLPGADAFFTVEASGSLPLRFLWFHNGTNLVGSQLLNSNLSMLRLANVQPADAGTYQAVVTNIAGSAASEFAALVVAANPPTIAQQPTNTSVPQGQIATFRVNAVGTTPIFYQWFRDQTSPIPGATGPVLTLPNAGVADIGSYHVVVSNRFGAVASQSATLDVTFTPPAISLQPADLSVYSGENATFTVTSTGSLPLSYQWFVNDQPISGATGPSLTLTNVAVVDDGSYFATVTNPGGTTNSRTAILTVGEAAPILMVQPTNADRLLGSNVTFSVSATGSQPLAYQWFLNDVEIPGATNVTLVLTNLAITNAGAYTVSVTNSIGSTGSDVATLTLLAPFTVSCTSVDPITCTITFESETGIDYTLQWLDTGPGQWMTLETRAGNGSTLQFMDVPSTTPTAPHYRIVVEPALAR